VIDVCEWIDLRSEGETGMSRVINQVGATVLRALARLGSVFDRAYMMDNVPLSTSIACRNWRTHLYELGNKEGMRILEIGSREVTGSSDARRSFSRAHYVGFDFYAGPNVDVVGDAHRLSSYFAEGEQFDIIYSSACFEHFAMPWVVATEIAKMLKIGGLVFVETHFSFGSHERPWNFFQFSDMGLKVLFSSALGFECIESGMSNPMVGRFSALADKNLRCRPIRGLFCHSEYLGKKVSNVETIDWNRVDPEAVVNSTVYPRPRAVIKS
jgi:SAM-dependent methyltransferase